MKNTTIQLPQIVRVDDYHEFDSIKNTINKLQPTANVEIKEVGQFNGKYTGLMYAGNLADYKPLLDSLLQGTGARF